MDVDVDVDIDMDVDGDGDFYTTHIPNKAQTRRNEGISGPLFGIGGVV